MDRSFRTRDDAMDLLDRHLVPDGHPGPAAPSRRPAEGGSEDGRGDGGGGGDGRTGAPTGCGTGEAGA
ncbi:hypothetical protein [Streptomyces sp. NPDC001380]|uniref:hypothetical protein n=1 Tax=Streptomyces sp. NPDC001380 TaxID=3364566 RepID=UPI003690BC0C